MGKLLRALKLQAPKPKQELKDSTDRIAGAEKTLDPKVAKALKLKESAQGVTANLTLLAKKIEPALLAAKEQELASLASRIQQRKPGDAGLVTDACELQMLLAETECALKDSTKNRAALGEARMRFGEALVRRLDKSGDLARDLQDYIDQHVKDGNTNRVTAALKAIDALRASGDPRVAKAAQDVSQALAREALRQQKEGGPSLAPREAPRTPNDVLVHLMSTLGEVKGLEKTGAGKLNKLLAEGRKLFMNHTVDTDKVKDLAGRAQGLLQELKQDPAAAQCGKLLSQLPKDGVKLQDTQLHDNLYGRVFDTKLVSTLVKDPPKALLDASAKSGTAYARMLPDSAENEEAAMYFVKEYVRADKRPWSAAVPAFDELAKAKNGKEALAALKKFLATPPATGQEIIAFSYIMAKMPQAQQKCENEPKWLTQASKNYGRITDQANRERGAPAKEKIMSQGAGITMLHQPDATGDDSLIESERPGTANRMGKRGGLTEGQDIGDMKKSTQNDIQLQNALPFASGVSGTTNILLSLYAELQTQTGGDGIGVSPQEFLMNSMMFLVYDGGHSMHEAMWTANQIEVELKTLKFGLADPDGENDVDNFVSDYDRFVDSFPEDVKQDMARAQETAWQGTQEYLRENSFFAQ